MNITPDTREDALHILSHPSVVSCSVSVAADYAGITDADAFNLAIDALRHAGFYTDTTCGRDRLSIVENAREAIADDWFPGCVEVEITTDEDVGLDTRAQAMNLLYTASQYSVRGCALGRSRTTESDEAFALADEAVCEALRQHPNHMLHGYRHAYEMLEDGWEPGCVEVEIVTDPLLDGSGPVVDQAIALLDKAYDRNGRLIDAAASTCRQEAYELASRAFTAALRGDGTCLPRGRYKLAAQMLRDGWRPDCVEVELIDDPRKDPVREQAVDLISNLNRCVAIAMITGRTTPAAAALACAALHEHQRDGETSADTSNRAIAAIEEGWEA